jgi:hypothetical protein
VLSLAKGYSVKPAIRYGREKKRAARGEELDCLLVHKTSLGYPQVNVLWQSITCPLGWAVAKHKLKCVMKF